MLNRTGRAIVSVLVAAVFAGTGAQAASAQPLAVASASSTVSSVDVVALQTAYRAVASPSDYKLAVSAYNSLVSGTATSRAALGSASAHVDLKVCVSIPKWAVVAYAWYVIGVGGATAIVGGFVDATIVGLPAGAVLNAIGIGTGITGTALLYWTDHTSWPKRIACIGW